MAKMPQECQDMLKTLANLRENPKMAGGKRLA